MVNPNLIPRFNIDYSFNDLWVNLFPVIDDYNNELMRIFGNKSFFFTNSGRSALYIILRSLGIPKGSKVGVPLYSCTVVFDAIIKAGFIPEFIDIDLENYTLDQVDLRKKINNLKALIVIHTFGRPADMDGIKGIARDIPIIEDCAHSLFSLYKGKMTGTLGNASFFSFKKYPSAGEGGMIILNDMSLKDNLEKLIFELHVPSKFNEIQHSFATYAHSFLYHRPWYGTISFPIGSMIINRNENETRGDFSVNLIRKGDMAVFMRKIGSLKGKIEKQRYFSKIIIEEIRNTSLIIPNETKGTWCNYFLFPIRLKNKITRDMIHVNLRKSGIDSAKLFSETPQISRRIYGYKGECPNAEELSDTVLIIPNYYMLSEKEIIKMADNINKLEESI